MVKKIKQIFTAFLSVVMLFTALIPQIGFSVGAAPMGKFEVSWDHTLTDEEGNVFIAGYGLKASDNPFSGKEIPPKAIRMHDYTAKKRGLTGDMSSWTYGEDYYFCYCIEREFSLPDDMDYEASSDVNFGDKYKLLSSEQRKLLALALAHGYPNRNDVFSAKDANACYSATQLIVWQITMGFRTSITELNDKTYPMSGYTGTMTEQYIANKYLRAYYYRILRDMGDFEEEPSFAIPDQNEAQVYEMKYENGKYSVTLIDYNHIIHDFEITGDDRLEFKKENNRLTITSDEPIGEEVLIEFYRTPPKTSKSTTFLIWTVPGKEGTNQDMVSGSEEELDPEPGYIKVKTENIGKITVHKTNPNNEPLANAYFTATNTLTREKYTIGPTDATGYASVEKLPFGSYSVEEVICPENYTFSSVKQWNITLNSSSHSAVIDALNIPKRGTVTVKKTSEDGLSEGIWFKLTGTSIFGNKVERVAYTDKNGIATFKDIEVGNGYVLEEIALSDKYIIPDAQDVIVEWNTVTNKNFHNELKKGSLIVTKTAEDGFVEGVQFKISGISISGAKVEEYAITDKNGVATFENILIGDEYTLEEVATAEKYVVPEPQSVTVIWNTATEKNFYNELKRGSVRVIKTSEDGLPSGITFKLSGTSLSGAAVEEYAVTDENGVATFENILIGDSYTVEEVATAEKYVVPALQSVTVEWNTVTDKNFYNELKRGSVRVLKSSEDGFVEGVRFHLYGTSISGNEIDLYAATDSNGIAMFENVLIGTDYMLEEVDVAEKYIIPEPQKVVVNWKETTEKVFYNELKRGSLEIKKTSEDGFVEGIVFKLSGTSLSGVVIEEYATTDANGIARFDNILISGEKPYKVEEVDTAIKYVVPEAQYAALSWNSVENNCFENILKKFKLKVEKIDSETGTAQGSADLSGAKYGLFKGNELIDQYVTDENGSFTTEEYVCGNDWSLQELSPSPGYQLDKWVYEIDSDPKLYTTEHNNIDMTVKEDVIKGNISIIKVDGENTASKLSGATFEIYEDSNGNGEFDVSADRFINILLEKERGIYEISDLPFGLYFVKETIAPTGFIRDNKVYKAFVEKNGETVYVSNIGNRLFANPPIKKPDNPPTGNVKAKKWSVVAITAASVLGACLVCTGRKKKRGE